MKIFHIDTDNNMYFNEIEIDPYEYSDGSTEIVNYLEDKWKAGHIYVIRKGNVAIFYDDCYCSGVVNEIASKFAGEEITGPAAIVSLSDAARWIAMYDEDINYKSIDENFIAENFNI